MILHPFSVNFADSFFFFLQCGTPPWLLAYLAFVCVTSLVDSSPLKVMSAPNMLHVETTENIFVECQDCTGGDIQVYINVRNHPTKARKLVTTSVTLNSANHFQAFGQIKIPAEEFSRDPTVKQYVNLQAQFPDYLLEKVVLVSFQSGHIFIETDKSLYTPGSKVLYRMFAVTPRMEPIESDGNNHEDSSIDIEIMTPEGITLPVESVPPKSGIHAGVFPLGEVISLGVWKVVAKFHKNPQQSYTAEFEVKEYVSFRFPALPSFEVKLMPESSFFYKDSPELTVNIKATYLSGEDVSGTAQGIFGVVLEGQKRSFPDSVQRVAVENGAGVVKLTREHITQTFQNIDNLVGSSIFVAVSVLAESGSEMVEAELRGIQIVTYPYTIHFKRTPKYFKPGMPIDVSIKVVNPDETPAQGVAVVVSPGDVRALTAADGLAKLPINTEARASDLRITVRVDLVETEHVCSAASKHSLYRQKVRVGPLSTRSVPFIIIPMTYGQFSIEVKAAVKDSSLSDGVMKMLRVMPEGVLIKSVQTIILDPTHKGTGGKQEVILNSGIPMKDWVPNTPTSTQISVTGSEVGPLVENVISGKLMGSLIQQPHGCGEQNLARMSLPVITTMYLDKTNQWETVGFQKRNEALQHIKTGYKNELTFQKQDGSFAVWTRTKSSTWLTAYVVKVFAMSSNLVEMQKNAICDAVKFLILKAQQPDGMFREVRRVIHREMISDMRGSDSDASMTAFCLIAMQESRKLCADTVSSLPGSIDKAVAYLEKRLPRLTNPYAVTMSSYALANQDKLNREILYKFASPELSHWNVPKGRDYTLEATAYALLALVKAKAFEDARPIVRWFNKQQQDGGGYGSTQATMIVYQAVAEYWASAQEPEYDLNVDIHLPGRPKPEKINFNRNNHHTTRTSKFNDINQDVKVTATGTGEATLKMVSQYYALPTENESDCQKFNLSVELIPEKMYEDEVIYKLRIEVLYKDKDHDATMSILDIGLLTGFTVNTNDLDLLAKGRARTIAKYEMDTVLSERGSLIIYLDKVSHTRSEEITFRIHQTLKVGVMQPAAVSVYEYYDQTQCVKFYHPERNDGQLLRLCRNEECTCAEENCSMQKKGKISSDLRTAKPCESTPDTKIDFVYKVRVEEFTDGLSTDIYTMRIMEVIKEGNYDVGPQGKLRAFLSYPHCREALDLGKGKTYLIMGTSEDIHKDQSYQYVLGERTWIEYWPTDAECQKDEHRPTCLGLEEMATRLHLNNGITTLSEERKAALAVDQDFTSWFCGTPPWLLASLAFACVSSLVDSSPLKVMSAPNVLRVGTTENIFVECQDCTGGDIQVHINVTNHPTKTRKLVNTSVTLNSANRFQAFGQIKIPAEEFNRDPTVKQYVYLQAQFPDHLLEKVVLVSFQSGYIFIQTDKSLYTPSSKVLYRMFAVTPRMEPIESDRNNFKDSFIDIEIMTPDDITLPVGSISPTSGIYFGVFQLEEIVSLGVWKVVAKFHKNPQQSYTAEFEVKEYVLPSFEVKLMPVSSFFYKDSPELTVYIKATYLSGEDVSGTAQGIFGVVLEGQKRSFPNSVQRVEVENGAGVVKLTREHITQTFQNIDNLVGSSIFVAVSVLAESGSEMVEAELRGIQIVIYPYTIHFKRTPKYFKPGMPFNVLIEVVNPDETPAQGVAVVVSPGDVRGLTAADGLAKLTFNTEARASDLRITVRVDLTETEHVCSAASKNARYRQEVRVGPLTTRSVPFIIVPMKYGQFDIEVKAAVKDSSLSDGVMKMLRVMPEGVLIKSVHTIILDPSHKGAGGKQEETLNSGIPKKDWVPNTPTSTQISVTGREVGPLVENMISGKLMGSLIKQPHGCGEQSMIYMSLSVIATMYLDRTNQWETVDFQKRNEALQHIKTGYKNELAYRLKDGSFAVWTRAKSNTWLTAYVVKVFAMSSNLVEMQKNVICDAVKFLILKAQRHDGMFREVGRVIHGAIRSDMRGSDSDASMTAFCLIAMQESRKLCADTVSSLPGSIDKAVTYLEKRLPRLTNPYAVTMSSYALANQDKLNREILYKFASPELSHWNVPKGRDYTLEATAYALLALVKAKAFEDARPIVRWFNKQQQDGGGYGSTQATMIVYQAVAEYWASAQEPEYDLNVDIHLPGRPKPEKINFNRNNHHTTRTSKFNDINQDVKVTATGTGEATLKMVSQYYALPMEKESDCQKFNLSVDLIPEKMYEDEVIYKLRIEVLYKDKDHDATMSILDIGLLTGFTVNTNDLDLLAKGRTRTIAKYEMDTVLSERGSLIIYLDKVSHTRSEEITFRIHQTLKVGVMQPAAVSVYEYYDQTQCVKFYHPERNDGQLLRLCRDGECPCAEENCSMQKKGKISNEVRTAKFTETSPTSKIVFAYKVRLEEFIDGLTADIYSMQIMEVIKDGTHDVGPQGKLRKFLSYPHCREAVDLVKGKTYLIMGTSEDIHKDQPDQYVLSEGTWIEYWPTDAECGTDEHRPTCLGLKGLVAMY
ncbi:complement C3-like [Solea senegalensis]|uniref:Complement C3-like n=1 Tax=Solea senegalensis TaxID=28829 RepID=A0AAV6PFQ6_SOLSE|nr:complement C3-like [Solea senegalensis]